MIRTKKNTFVLAEGGLSCTNIQAAAKDGQVRTYTSKVSKVSEVSRVSRVSEVSKVSGVTKQDEQQSLHSLLPLGEGARRPDEGLKRRAKDAQSQCPHLEGGPKSPISRRGSERSELLTPHQGGLACTTTLETAKEARSTIIHDVPRHEVAEPASCKFLSWICSTLTETRLRSVAPAGSFRSLSGLTSFRPSANPLITQSLSHLITSQKAAFTLAEVLITLAVIGIVAALTLPGLIQNHNEKAWSTAKDLWEKKLTETVRRMNIDGVMTGHDTTEDFMNTFKNYMKVIKTCDNNDINKCYSPKIVQTGSDSEPIEIETSDLKTAENLGNDWGTNTMSFVVADGTTAIFAYNPNCAYADPIEDTGSQVSCLAYMVDVNGKKGPNKVTQDIALVGQIALSNCDNPIGDMCFSTDFFPEALDTTLEENQQYDPNYAVTDNYWAGAKKACSDMQMSLPTRAQLAQLASNLYVDRQGNEVTIGEKEDKRGIKLKDEYSQNHPITLAYLYWSREERNTAHAYTRDFDTNYSDGSDELWGYKDGRFARVVCLGS